MMNKWLRTACAGALLAGALAVSAFAADFTECADHLKDLGLFRGAAQGYELDRAPTRAEAAAMLVRLLGCEQEAAGLEYTAPFTDLANWQKPYVQYLYENGLTTGATATTFDPESACTARMYAAFLLRALGYTEEEGDFTYREAEDFAHKAGLYDASTVDEAQLLRDHVAAVSYTALSLQPKGEDGTLLDRLVEAGAVERSAAAPYQELFSVYGRYHAATAGMEGLTALSVEHDLTVDTGSMTMHSAETAAIDLTAPASLSSRVVTLSAPGMEDKTLTAESYTANGFYYLRQGSVRSRRALTAEQQRTAFSGYARVPVALVEEIAASPSGSYTIRYSAAGMARLDTVLSAAKAAVGDFADMKLDGLMVTQTVSDGRITAQKCTLRFAADGLSGTVQSEMKLLGVNEAVTVGTPANLDQYPLVK